MSGLAGLLLERLEAGCELGVDGLVVERPGDVLDVVQQALKDVLVGFAAREALDRFLALGAVVLVLFFFARDADQVEALGQGAVVGQVVEGRQQFAPGQVAGGAEDDERRRCDRQALEAGCQRVLGLLRVSGARPRPPPQPPLARRPPSASARAPWALLTAWPPNWLRSAASTRSAKSPLPRERKRA